MTETLTIVPAGAGSGKTHRIKSDLTDWVRKKLVRPDRILAVTFTEAAAGELRDRLRSSLLAEGLVDEALEVERAYVSTIHGLGLRLLTEHAFAAGASPRPRPLADAERDQLIRQVMAQAPSLAAVRADLPRFGYVAQGWTDNTAEDGFRGALFAAIDLLRGLGDNAGNPQLAKAAVERVRTLYGHVSKDPAPLEARLRAAVRALLDAFPEGIADLFDKDAPQKEFRKNHAALRRALRPGELARDWKLWVALTELRLSKRGSQTPEPYDDLAAEVMTAAGAIATHPGPLEDACAHVEALIHGAQEVLEHYAEEKRAAGVIDYADMVTGAERLLRTRPEVLTSLLDQVDCVIIDEFQDTNPVQFALLWRIAQAAKRVLIVGDTKQSIMGFQGADPRLSSALEDQNRATVQPLDRNWRSAPELMELVNAISEGLFGENYVHLTPQRAPTGTQSAEVLRISEGRRSRKSRPEQHLAAHLCDLLAAGDLVADRDSPLDAPRMRPVQPADIALLCPTNKMAANYADALTRLGVPVRINTEGWRDSPTVSAACHALAFAADPGDLHAGLCLLTLGPAARPLEDAMRALGSGTLADDPFLVPLVALALRAADMPLPQLLETVLATTGIAEWATGLPAPAQHRADLLRLEAEAEEFIAAPRDLKAAAGFHGFSAPVFLGWLDARRSERNFDRRPDPDSGGVEGVELVTWHASKGREWPITAVVGLDDALGERPGTLRAEFSDFSNLDAVLGTARLIWTPGFALKEKTQIFTEDRRAASEEDARRLLYVALTRARDRLVLEWPDFALKKVGEEPGPANHAEMLLDAGVSPGAGGLQVGGKAFAARVIDAGSDATEPASTATVSATTPWPSFGTRKPKPNTPRTPWRQRPSQIETGGDKEPDETRVIPLGPSLPVTASFASATERGTALHLAFRTLLTRPELRPRLGAATGLDETSLEVLAERAQALKAWLSTEGFDRLHAEVPIQRRDASGAELSGVIDLLAEGPDGSMIIDHKSGNGDYAQYRVQLEAYVGMLVERFGRVSPCRTAIHWLDRGELEIPYKAETIRSRT